MQFLSVLLIFVCMIASPEVGAEEIVITPVIVEVTRTKKLPSFEKDWDTNFPLHPRTRIGLLVELPEGRRIVGSPAADRRMTSLTDDTGRNLLAEMVEGAAILEPIRTLKETPHLGLTGVELSAAPARSAQNLQCVGRVRLTTASGAEEREVKTSLRPGRLDLAGEQIELVSVGKPEDPKAMGPVVTLRAAGDSRHRIQRFEFLDAKGNPLQSRLTRDVPAEKHREWQYTLIDPAHSVTIRIRLWKELREQDVPFQFELPLP